MPDKVIDLGECRTGYTSDITDDGSDDTFNHVLQWESTNTNPNIVETVVDSEVVLNQDSDSGTSLVDNGNNTFTYSGMFGVETFPNVSMTFRTDFVNDIDKTITGWPPSDPRAKDVYSFSLDPTGTKNINIWIEFKVKATNNGIPITTSPYVYDSELDEYVRTDKFVYIKEAINKTGLIFGSELNKFIKGEELSISDLPTIEPEPNHPLEDVLSVVITNMVEGNGVYTKDVDINGAPSWKYIDGNGDTNILAIKSLTVSGIIYYVWSVYDSVDDDPIHNEGALDGRNVYRTLESSQSITPWGNSIVGWENESSTYDPSNYPIFSNFTLQT